MSPVCHQSQISFVESKDLIHPPSPPSTPCHHFSVAKRVTSPIPPTPQLLIPKYIASPRFSPILCCTATPGKGRVNFTALAPLGERVARRGVFISRGETGEGVSPIVKSNMGPHTSALRSSTASCYDAHRGEVNPKSKIENPKSAVIAPNWASIFSTTSGIRPEFWRRFRSRPAMW